MSDHPAIILETERTVLRKLTLDDLDDLFALYREPNVRKYFPEGTLTYDETREELEWIIDVYYAQYGFGLWATLDKQTGEFIGRCGLLPWTIENRQEVEVAYMLAERVWRQGLGAEVARAVVVYGFEQLQLPRLICIMDEKNTASTKVAVKMGMGFEKIIEINEKAYLMYARNR
jgi:ribosomal-protein-alanine N-acetyltransferase